MKRAAMCLGALLLALIIRSDADATTILDEGTADIDSPVACGAHKGRVVVRTGVHLQEQEVDMHGISLAFQADQGNALECCWVQFTRAEAVATIDSAGAAATLPIVGVPFNTSGGQIVFSTAAAPAWFVDSAGASPCYESKGVSIKDRTGTRIFDGPDNLAGVVARAFGRAGTTVLSVEVKWCFDSYLVCNRNVCYRVTWTLLQTWTQPPGGPPLIDQKLLPPPNGSAGGTLPPELKAAANREHPGQTVLPP
jgi:hypothetical protein